MVAHRRSPQFNGFAAVLGCRQLLNFGPRKEKRAVVTVNDNRSRRCMDGAIVDVDSIAVLQGKVEKRVEDDSREDSSGMIVEKIVVGR